MKNTTTIGDIYLDKLKEFHRQYIIPDFNKDVAYKKYGKMDRLLRELAPLLLSETLLVEMLPGKFELVDDLMLTVEVFIESVEIHKRRRRGQDTREDMFRLFEIGNFVETVNYVWYKELNEKQGDGPFLLTVPEFDETIEDY